MAIDMVDSVSSIVRSVIVSTTLNGTRIMLEELRQITEEYVGGLHLGQAIKHLQDFTRDHIQDSAKYAVLLEKLDFTTTIGMTTIQVGAYGYVLIVID